MFDSQCNQLILSEYSIILAVEQHSIVVLLIPIYSYTYYRYLETIKTK